MLNPLLMNRVEARNGVRPDPCLILYRRPAKKGKPRSRLQAIPGFGHAGECGADIRRDESVTTQSSHAQLTSHAQLIVQHSERGPGAPVGTQFWVISTYGLSANC